MSLFDDASLVLIPDGAKDGTLYSVKPTDGTGDFTFTRGSNLAATRVDENGLIEKGRENLILQSNQFDTTWFNINTTDTGGQTDKDGGSTAWLIEKSASAGYIRQNNTTSGVQTYSVYAKANALNWIAIEINGVGYAYYDLANGVKGSSSAGLIDAKIESIGSGWYRCSITYNATISQIRIYPADGDANLSGTSGSIYIQDAQLEYGLVATDYIETGATTAQAGILEDMPRLDYSGGTCPALLLEPQRTNLIAQSEYLLGSFTLDNVSLTHNYGTSPDGGNNSVLITQTGTSASNSIYNFGLPTTDGSYTYSFFFRAGTSTNCRFYVATGISEDFNPQTITAGYSGGALNILFEDYGNGWWRASATQTLSSAPFNRFILYPDRNNSGQNIEVYGFQVEQNASYPTSYIPTYGTSVTRGADSCSKTGISSLIGQTEGTLFVEVDTAVLGEVFIGNSRRFLTISDETTTNRINIFQSFSNDSIQIAVTNAGVSQASISSSANQSGIKKIAVGYANNDFVMYVNGVQIGTDTSGSVPACSRVGVGSFETSANTANAASPVSQALIFKTRLSNTDLATLTTP